MQVWNEINLLPQSYEVLLLSFWHDETTSDHLQGLNPAKLTLLAG